MNTTTNQDTHFMTQRLTRIWFAYRNTYITIGAPISPLKYQIASRRNKSPPYSALRIIAMRLIKNLTRRVDVTKMASLNSFLYYRNGETYLLKVTAGIIFGSHPMTCKDQQIPREAKYYPLIRRTLRPLPSFRPTKVTTDKRPMKHAKR